jgi:hypothetical protein
MRNTAKRVAWIKLALAGAGATCLFALAAGNGPQRVVPATLGAYKVEIRGAFSGRGTAAVGAQSVTVNGQVRDESGNVSHLVAPGIPIIGGRFDGNGTIAGISVRVCGRIDPPSEVTTGPRLSMQIDGPQQRASRAVGTRSRD